MCLPVINQRLPLFPPPWLPPVPLPAPGQCWVVILEFLSVSLLTRLTGKSKDRIQPGCSGSSPETGYNHNQEPPDCTQQTGTGQRPEHRMIVTLTPAQACLSATASHALFDGKPGAIQEDGVGSNKDRTRSARACHCLWALGHRMGTTEEAASKGGNPALGQGLVRGLLCEL